MRTWVKQAGRSPSLISLMVQQNSQIRTLAPVTAKRTRDCLLGAHAAVSVPLVPILQAVIRPCPMHRRVRLHRQNIAKNTALLRAELRLKLP
jgi:hypothetical protein